jgi:hypothetical protein
MDHGDQEDQMMRKLEAVLQVLSLSELLGVPEIEEDVPEKTSISAHAQVSSVDVARTGKAPQEAKETLEWLDEILDA